MKITIIGAGIGGLTTAIALRQQGFTVEIFEAAPAFKEAGSGIILAINAMQIYKRLGVDADIVKAGNEIQAMKAVTPRLKLLTEANFRRPAMKYGVSTIAIHRAALHEILLQHLGETKIHLGKKLVSMAQTTENVELTFADGSRHTAEVLLGADGIKSVVRNSLFDTSLRDAGQICWRGIAPATTVAEYKHELYEIWGRGKRFGFVHIGNNAIYWYALLNKDKYASEKTMVQQLFADYHPVVNRIISNTPAEKILYNEIWDLQPIAQWHRGRVCLIGDAAHATTPNMGQGACQAIESAWVLSTCLREETDLTKAFSQYQQLRQQKANYIVNTSWQIGKIAQTDSPLIGSLRNLIAPLIPAVVTQKQNDKIFRLNY